MGSSSARPRDATFILGERDLLQPRAGCILSGCRQGPNISAYAFRHSTNVPFNHPTTTSVMRAFPQHAVPRRRKYIRTRAGAAAEVLFILPRRHEHNCSTACARHRQLASAPYSALAWAAAALYGPMQAAANEPCCACSRIGRSTTSGVHQRVKGGECPPHGFGHRSQFVHPRAKSSSDGALVSTQGRTPLLEYGAGARTEFALEDELRIAKLYPNVDFCPPDYQAIGLPVDMFPVPSSDSRTAGDRAVGIDVTTDHKIARPRRSTLGLSRAPTSPKTSAVLRRPGTDKNITRSQRSQASWSSWSL